MPKVGKSKTKKTSGNIRKLIYDRTNINKETEIGILDFLKLIRQEMKESEERVTNFRVERSRLLEEGKEEPKETEEQRKESDKSIREFMESNDKWELEQKEARKYKLFHMDNAYWKEKNEALSSDKEKLIWIFRTIKKIKERDSIGNGPFSVGYSEIIVKPFFILEDFELEFNSLFKYINADKDFFRKHNMTNYTPRFELPLWGNENHHIKFYDFTNDFIKAYMRDKLGIKTNIKEPLNPYISLKSGDVIGCVPELIWLFNLLLKKGEGIYTDGTITAVRVKKIREGPFSFFKDKDDGNLSYDLYLLLKQIGEDKEFLKKHNMENYHPSYYWNQYSFVDNGLVFFADFTDDFLKAYLEDEERLGMKFNTIINNKQPIQKIEVMIPTNEWAGIDMYINGNYNNPINFKNGKYIELFYTLAQDQRISSSRGLVSYFNSNKANPLYKRTDFSLSKILTKNGNSIEPSIPIILRTSKFISHARNKISEENKKLKPA